MNINDFTTLTPREIAAIQMALPSLSTEQKLELLQDLEVREQRARLTAAKDNMLGFAQAVYPGFKIGPHHRKLAKIFTDVIEGKKSRVIINIAPRMGKLLADETLVLTENRGWVTHGELVIGDKVFHPSGKPISVLGVSEKAAANVRVEFFDGSVFYCHENHEWTLYNNVSRKWETKETNEFFEPRKGRWGKTTTKNKKQVLCNNRALHSLPLVEPLEYPEKDFLLHPYVLGVWLGDGTKGKPNISHAAADVEHIKKVISLGYEVSSQAAHKVTGVLGTSFGGTVNRAGRLTKELQTLGIYNSKRIPEQYLRGSVSQRLELLAGLIDTDGTVDKNSRCSFSNINKELIDGVQELAQSFGWRTTVYAAAPRTSSSGVQGKHTCYTVAFQPTISIPTAIPRKTIKRCVDRRRIGLKTVTQEVSGKIGNCITVDSPDGLYLVGKNLVPTHNSEFSSYLFPAYFLGKYPEKKIIMGTHTAGLSEDFGRRIRNLLSGEDYAKVFPSTQVADDQKAAGKWSTSMGGQYYAAGVGGALAGRGADLFVIDDPHSEQDVKANSRLAFDTAWSWFQTGPLQRLMPGGAIIIIMTRWGKLDLTGRLIDYQAKNPSSIPWEIVELPAILNEGTDKAKSLWPEQWSIEQLLATKASIDPQYWNAQYMQNPTSNNAAIVSRKLWRIWPGETPPHCEYIIQAWDTAHETKTSSDYSACTTWGVFYNEEENDKAQIILLDAFKDRMQFPELKAEAFKQYKEWEPDALIVEKKSAGAPLIQEMRRTGIPIQEVSPSRGNDKITRINAISDLFASGMVWAPDTRWARDVIEELASFPNGDHDDFCDCISMSLLRFRQGGFITLDSDEKDEPSMFRRKTKAYY